MKRFRYFYLAMSLLLIVLAIHTTAFAEEPEADPPVFEEVSSEPEGAAGSEDLGS